MKNSDYILIDAESIGTDMKRVSDLLDIITDELEDNGELAARRELTVSALYVIKDHLAMLADMQMNLVGHIIEQEKEARA